MKKKNRDDTSVLHLACCSDQQLRKMAPDVRQRCRDSAAAEDWSPAPSEMQRPQRQQHRGTPSPHLSGAESHVMAIRGRSAAEVSTEQGKSMSGDILTFICFWPSHHQQHKMSSLRKVNRKKGVHFLYSVWLYIFIWNDYGWNGRYTTNMFRGCSKTCSTENGFLCMGWVSLTWESFISCPKPEWVIERYAAATQSRAPWRCVNRGARAFHALQKCREARIWPIFFCTNRRR